MITLLKIFILIGLIFLSGCASIPSEFEDIQISPLPIQRRHQIEAPFYAQESLQCGPTTLAMAIHHAGGSTSIEELTVKVFTTKNGGSLQSDMVSGARREGFVAISLKGLKKLLTEVDANHPVIVFENLGLSWWPKWHYALVVGYDLDRQEIYMHSGQEANQVVPLKHFEFAWGLAGNWGLVVLPPGQLAESGDEFSHVSATSLLEAIHHQKAAETSYHAILKKWPNSLGAMIGLGNIYYSSGRIKEAVAILKRATQEHRGSKAAQHNYEVAVKTLNGTTPQ